MPLLPDFLHLVMDDNPSLSEEAKDGWKLPPYMEVSGISHLDGLYLRH